MKPPFEIEYDFEEVRVLCEGLPAEGTALLKLDTCCDASDPDMFYVEEITLKGGLRLDRYGSGYMGLPNAFKKELFRIISHDIEASDHAEEFFLKAIADTNEPDHDTARKMHREEITRVPGPPFIPATGVNPNPSHAARMEARSASV